MSAASPRLTFKAACIQVNTSDDMAESIGNASAFARAAVKDGADLVMMPENVSMMAWGRENTLAKAMPEETHAALAAFRKLAPELGVWLHCGSLAVKLKSGKIANRTYVIDPKGQVAAHYDKIHMFDVNLGNGERYAESSTFEAGDAAVSIDLPWGRLGLTICYDLRFPNLYRHLAQQGVDFIAVPSAFTRPTGEAHWHVLLRARAIETGCFVFAPAQTGVHAGERKTFGHSLIINPWGEVLADGGLEPGVISAAINPAEVGHARARIPALSVRTRFSDGLASFNQPPGDDEQLLESAALFL